MKQLQGFITLTGLSGILLVSAISGIAAVINLPQTGDYGCILLPVRLGQQGNPDHNYP